MPEFGFETTADEVASEFKDIIKGKVVLITGCSPKGLGAEAARVIAAHSPALLILAGRSPTKTEETAKVIQDGEIGVTTRVLELDLGSLASVRKAAAEVNDYPEAIDVLINNAGIMAMPYSKTVDGFESHFGTNHLGHFLFTNLITPKLFAAKEGARVVNVSSNGYKMAPFNLEDVNFEKSDYNKWAAYSGSKSANILFTRALAERLGSKGISTFSLDPGAIPTNLSREMSQEEFGAMRESFPDLKFKTLPQGAATHIAAAFDPSLQGSSGSFMENSKVATLAEAAPWVHGKENSEKLWKISEDLVGQKFEY